MHSSNSEFGVAVTAKRAVRLTRFESMAAESPSEFYHVFHKKGDHRNVNSNTITGGSDGWTKLVAPAAGQSEGAWMGYPSIDLVLAGGETHTLFVKGSNDGAVACMGNGGGEVSDDAMTVTGCKQEGRNPWAPICRIGYADAAPAAATGQSKAAPA